MLAYLFPMLTDNFSGDEKDVISIERDEPFTLEEMQELVGGYVQVIPIPRLNMAYAEINIDEKDLLMLIDEEGKMKGSKPNMAGTIILQANGYMDYAVGNVVICDARLVQ